MYDDYNVDTKGQFFHRNNVRFLFKETILLFVKKIVRGFCTVSLAVINVCGLRWQRNFRKYL